jgi:secreted trypsin-like serine protease
MKQQGIEPLIKLTTLLTALLLSIPSSAIVIRHDVEDTKYHAQPSDFPALATFYVDGAHGTLIKPSWVVTAAHATFCVRPNAKVMINGKARVVAGVYVHNEYTPGKSHDIALVQLSGPVADVTPASTYSMSDEQGKNIWFIGIGGTGDGILGQTIDNAANKGQMRKAQNVISEASGPLLKFTFDRGSNALPLEGVSGGGDSGGPAYTFDENGSTLLGVSSRFENGGMGQYGITEIYSRVSYFDAWINEVISGDEQSRQDISVPKLNTLPAGLTPENLSYVCDDIGIK